VRIYDQESKLEERRTAGPPNAVEGSLRVRVAVEQRLAGIAVQNRSRPLQASAPLMPSCPRETTYGEGAAMELQIVVLAMLVCWLLVRAVVRDGRGPPPTKAEVAANAAARCSSPGLSRAALSCAPVRSRGLRWPELMQRVFAIDVLLCPRCGGRMKAIAEITDKRVARKMLEHVGLPSDPPEQWSARGPPGLVGSSPWFDDAQRASGDETEPATDVE
jgi:hypothetical protein